MRCPSCGTENAPDSRFCGGCGAKLTPAAGAVAARLAPTAKIPDDAAFPPPSANPYGATGPASIPPSSHGPASIPPSNHGRPSSIPPHAAQRAATPVPAQRPSSSLGRAPSEPAPQTQQRKPIAVPTPAGSMAGDSFVPPPQRPLGLIAIVLVIDLALAGAGAVLLSKGLSANKIKEQPADPKAPTMQQRSDVTPAQAPAPTPAPSPSPVEAVAAAAPEAKTDTKVPAAASSLLEAKTDKSPTRGKDTKKKGTSTASSGTSTASSGTSTGTGTASGPVTHPGGTTPEDPYKEQPPTGGGGFDLKAESNKLASQSGDLFARCLAASGTVHGTIKVAYRVEVDGRVTHPYAVENSTGNEQLGICLSDVIATWRFSPHAGDAQNAVRPFTYP